MILSISNDIIFGEKKKSSRKGSEPLPSNLFTLLSFSQLHRHRQFSSLPQFQRFFVSLSHAIPLLGFVTHLPQRYLEDIARVSSRIKSN